MVLSLALAGVVAAQASAADVVRVLHAGSLITVMQRELIPAFAKTGRSAEGEGRGSVANAAFIRDGLKNPDVFISADDKVMDDLMRAKPQTVPWYAVFATTRLVIGYSPRSRFAAELHAAAIGRRAWTDVLSTPGLKLVRTDPAIDPKGYRTIISVKLAEQHYGALGLEKRILGDDRNADQLLTDEAILVRLESGDADAAFLYAPEAIARHLPVIELPPVVNLGEPRYATLYSSQSVIVGGVERRGAPIAYALTVPHDAPNPTGADAFVRFILRGEGRSILARSGFTMIKPQLVGDVKALPPGLATLH
ncbi:MAG: extracellular solute-binding protein [Candidatus Velthaea sp.]